MRIAGPDIVLFAVGALLFGGATYAIANTDGGLTGSGSALGIYQVSWSATEVEVDSADVASLRSATETFTLNASNVASVIVTVTCADPAPGPAAFTISVDVAGPDGFTGSGSGSCSGSGVVVPVEVAPAPEPAQVQGATEAEARENLASGNATGGGEWTVTVSGGRGGGAIPVPVGDPSGTIAFSIETYEPRLTPIQR